MGKLYERLLSGPGETWQCYFPCEGQEVSDAELAGYAVSHMRLTPLPVIRAFPGCCAGLLRMRPDAPTTESRALR